MIIMASLVPIYVAIVIALTTYIILSIKFCLWTGGREAIAPDFVIYLNFNVVFL